MVALQSEVSLVSSFSVDFAFKKDFLNGLISFRPVIQTTVQFKVHPKNATT